MSGYTTPPKSGVTCACRHAVSKGIHASGAVSAIPMEVLLRFAADAYDSGVPSAPGVNPVCVVKWTKDRFCSTMLPSLYPTMFANHPIPIRQTPTAVLLLHLTYPSLIHDCNGDNTLYQHLRLDFLRNKNIYSQHPYQIPQNNVQTGESLVRRSFYRLRSLYLIL